MVARGRKKFVCSGQLCGIRGTLHQVDDDVLVMTMTPGGAQPAVTNEDSQSASQKLLLLQPCLFPAEIGITFVHRIKIK